MEQRLRDAGLRVTAPRVAVLRELELHSHADVDTIAGAVRERHHAVSTQAVYDVLRVLTRHGLTRRIEPPGSPARYENRVGDNHHHIVCRGCGVIGDIDCTVGAAPCLEPSDTHGFAVDEAEIVFWGTCPACLAAGVTGSPDRAALATADAATVGR
ncbi:MAG: transcriptional repressor [Pseudonocardiales bacterium]|nr:transcriptional repressor [Pseudonocardiales bacterium]